MSKIKYGFLAKESKKVCVKTVTRCEFYIIIIIIITTRNRRGRTNLCSHANEHTTTERRLWTAAVAWGPDQSRGLNSLLHSYNDESTVAKDEETDSYRNTAVFLHVCVGKTPI